MSAGRICVRDVLVAEPGESVREATQRMQKADVASEFEGFAS